MFLDTDLLRRRTTRLLARDYSSPGNYFVTLCAHERRLLFGDIDDGIMHLNDLGQAVDTFWNEIPRHFPHAELDEYIVMPNHVHGIIRIVRHPWESGLPAVRAVGTPIVSGLVDAGQSVGANNYSPLQDRNPTRVVDIQRPRGTSRTIGSMVRGFKIAVTRWTGTHAGIPVVWQRNYHDHIIRNRRSLERVRAYIRANPTNWARDRQNPERTRGILD
jgi:putative transposase